MVLTDRQIHQKQSLNKFRNILRLFGIGLRKGHMLEHIFRFLPQNSFILSHKA